MRFVFFYLMSDNPDRIREVAARHAAYWHDLALRECFGGPFADRTGGLITFEAGAADQAEQIVEADPFLREGLLASWWLEQWLPEPAVPTRGPEDRP